jgi:hypothetical protein
VPYRFMCRTRSSNPVSSVLALVSRGRPRPPPALATRMSTRPHGLARPHCCGIFCRTPQACSASPGRRQSPATAHCRVFGDGAEAFALSQALKDDVAKFRAPGRGDGYGAQARFAGLAADRPQRVRLRGGQGDVSRPSAACPGTAWRGVGFRWRSRVGAVSPPGLAAVAAVTNRTTCRVTSG